MSEEMQAAFSRVENAALAGRAPDREDLETACLCPSCWGFGYYYVDVDGDEEKTCGSCGGDGLAGNHPCKGK